MYDIVPVMSQRSCDCGACCMQMLLSYYGKTFRPDTLQIHTFGCTGKDLLVCGREHGMDMRAYKMDAYEIIRQDRPAIVWWKYSHFCVFCGVDENGKVVICNPDRGRYRVSKSLFKSMYTDISFTNGIPEKQ